MSMRFRKPMVEIFVYFILVSVLNAFAGESGLAFLKISAGARPSGMGSAFVALSNDASAPFWNPAGIAAVTQKQAQFTYTRWFQDVRHQMGSLVFPAGLGHLGVGLLLTSVDGFERRTIASEEPLGTFSSQDVLFLINYARRLSPSLHVGLVGKYLYEKIYVESASGWAVDLGLKYRTPIAGLSAGASLQNVGNTSAVLQQSIDLPLIARAGLVYTLLSEKMIVALDYVFIDQRNHLHIGAELEPLPLLYLRAGYQSNYQEMAFSTGIGFSVGAFRMDYAFVPFDSDLGNTQRFAVLTRF